MARFLKPLFGAVALAAATLTSTAALAQSYNYNAQITISAPKGSAAEAAAKNKSLPTGIKFSTCAPKSTGVTPNIQNADMLNFAIKYDAGKAANEISDVFLVFQNLTEDVGLINNRYFAAVRSNMLPVVSGSGVVLVDGGSTVAALDAALVSGASQTVFPFISVADNLGTGAQTEVLFGSNLNLTGLPKGLWAVSVVIAKPGATYDAAGAETNTTFMFSRPETWAAHDTAVFSLGTPFGISTASAPTAPSLIDYGTNIAAQYCE